MASHSLPTSNQIVNCLKEIEGLRKLLPEVSGLPQTVGNLSEKMLFNVPSVKDVTKDMRIELSLVRDV